MSYDLGLISEVNIFSEKKIGTSRLIFQCKKLSGRFLVVESWGFW
jgi:hypothetical protein